MVKKQIIYFYEYASELRGGCVGHAKIVADIESLRISLAFSLPTWKKKECPVYMLIEDEMSNVETIHLGSIYPNEILTVYNFKMKLTEIKKSRRIEYIGICVLENLGDDGKICIGSRYIKALSGVMNVTLQVLLQNIDNEKNIYSGNALEYMEKSTEDTKKEFVNPRQQAKHQEGQYEILKKQYESRRQQSEKQKQQYECVEQQCEERGQKFEKPELQHNEGDKNRSHQENCLYGRLMERRPEYNPFTNGRIKASVKISISDIAMISEQDPGLKENSFLMHSFYKYKHILLAAGNSFGQKCFFVLAPGLRTVKEQRMADMYGFHNFMSLNGQSVGAGGFGYYSWML